MRIEILSQIGKFFVLVALQVLLLNHVHLFGYANPFLYILFIISLPFETPKPLLLFLALFTGLSVDIFTNTLGLHASASLITAFSRPLFLTVFSPREGYEFSSRPHLQDYGLGWFISYAGSLTLIHHVSLFSIEYFRFAEFFTTLGRSFISVLFSLAIMIVVQYLTFSQKAKE